MSNNCEIFKTVLLLRAGDIETNPGPIFNLESGNCSLSILQLNIRSIRNKLSYINDHLSDFDILCFSETHLDDNVSNTTLQVDTYESSLYRRDLNSHSSGLLVCVSNQFVSKWRLDLELDNVHAIWVEVKYRNSSFLLCNVYRSPGTPVVSIFNISIERAIESNKDIVIVGDLNQELLAPNETHLRNVLSINNLNNVNNKTRE